MNTLLRYIWGKILALKDSLIKADKWAMKSLKQFKATFLGLITTKLLSEVFLAILVAMAVYVAQSWYGSNQVLKIENENYNNISVGVYTEYVNSLFGIPKVNFIDETTGSRNSFYVMDGSVLRTVCDESGTVVAYFITITNKGRTVRLDGHDPLNDFVLGKNDFSVLPNPLGAEANISNGLSAYSYYCEKQYFGSLGGYCDYFYGIVDYGYFNTEKTGNLVSAAFHSFLENDTLELDQIYEHRVGAVPNTFGVVSMGYDKDISIIPFSDGWVDVYRMLKK
ncbi:hypothetical protein LJC32_00660 [Oscillospiraceae bacterium OttesenSCG-928-F05]|nr:hypothetical protein [Oscillospiraceae bacterium OttesenSCG-928-F05]